MTPRAVLLGLLGAVLICGFAYLNDVVMRQMMLIGNHMPVGVYGSLIVFLLILHPLLKRARIHLSGTELAVALTLTLAACCIPASGLMRTFTAIPVAPYVLAETHTGWREQGIIEMTPEAMRADVTQDRDRVVDGFLKGLPRENLTESISVTDIPWSAWVRPLTFWLPLIAAVWIAMLGLSLVLHRQWSEHEHLPYPLARFTNDLLPAEGAEGREGRGGLLRQRLFWLGALPVLVIHLNNYACKWFPDSLITVQTHFSLHFLFEQFPFLWQAHLRGGINAVQMMMEFFVFFSVIAFAYFLPRDVSLSLGLGSYLFMFVAAFFHRYGIWRGDAPHRPKMVNMLTSGAYIGVFCALLYTGRRHYLRVFRRALIPGIGGSGESGGSDEIERTSVWGARVFLAGLAFFVVALTAVGLDWQLGLLFALGLTVIYVVMSRMLAETGLFYMMSWWGPGVILLAFLGNEALGVRNLLILNLLGIMFFFGDFAIASREALMPTIVNALRFLDLRGVRLGRSVVACGAALVVGLLVALPLTLYFQYDRGVLALGSPGHHTQAPRYAYQHVVQERQQLMARNAVDHASTLGGWERFAEAVPDTRALTYFAIGLGLVLLLTFCRLRFARWPLHPVLLLVCATHPGRILAPSFLIGWLIKSAVTRYGGIPTYRKGMPLMFGILAGELVGALAVIAIGAVYYMITGQPGRIHRIMPF